MAGIHSKSFDEPGEVLELALERVAERLVAVDLVDVPAPNPLLREEALGLEVASDPEGRAPP